jgi:hypothetical protein
MRISLCRRGEAAPDPAFRLPELSDESYRHPMTAPSVKLVTSGANVRIAGVPWPVYKLVALAVGLLVLVVVGVATATVGPAVVAGSAAGTVVWLALGTFHSSDS